MSAQAIYERTVYGWKKPLDSGQEGVSLTMVVLDPHGNTGKAGTEHGDMFPGSGDNLLRGHTGTQIETVKIISGGDANNTLIHVARDKDGEKPTINEFQGSGRTHVTVSRDKYFWHNLFNPSHKYPLLLEIRALKEVQQK